MNVFYDAVRAFGAIPDWGLMLLPALLAVYTLATVLFGGRKAYPYVAFSALPLAAVLGAGRGAAADLVYVGCTAAFAGVLRLSLFLPRRKRTMPDTGLTPAGPAAARAERTVVETPAYIPIGQCGLDMAQAEECLARLKRAPLSAGDRLEVEVLGRILDGANRAALTEEELARVNDGLASMIKIAAKYKI